MYQDPEIIAMSEAFAALRELHNDQRNRIINWLSDRFDLEGKRPQEAAKPAPAPEPEPEIKPVKKPKAAEAVKEEKPAAAKVPEKKDFVHYDTALELFSEAKLKKSTERILLMAAYLQERHGFKEITSYDMNFRLKRIGHGVSNISSSLNSILNKKPQLIIQMEKEGTAKQKRRKFKVTVEGLRVARGFLPGN